MKREVYLGDLSNGSENLFFKLEGPLPFPLCRCRGTSTPPYCDFTHFKKILNKVTLGKMGIPIENEEKEW